MTRIPVLDSPEFLAAVAQERLVRDAAFIGVNEDIAGFEVVPLTLWHFLVLRVKPHPLLAGKTPTPQELEDFLWLLSPDYSPTSTRAHLVHHRRCRRLFYPPKYLALINTWRARLRYRLKRLRKFAAAAKVIEAAKAYLAEAMQDKPDGRQVMGWEPDYYSDGAAFCALFAREFHYSEAETLRMPMKRIFQYLKERKAHLMESLSNPSDAVKARIYADLNAQLKAEREEARLAGNYRKDPSGHWWCAEHNQRAEYLLEAPSQQPLRCCEAGLSTENIGCRIRVKKPKEVRRG